MKIPLPLFVILSLIVVSTSYASDKDTPGTERHSLEAGKSALQFRISENFLLTSFQGSLLSYKYHFSKSTAIRMDLSLSSELNNRETKLNREEPGLTMENGLTADDRFFDVSLRSQLQSYFHTKQQIKPYISYGILTGYSYVSGSSNQYADNNNDPVQRQEEEKSGQGYQIGLTGNMGLEWFASESISLLAEYGLDAYYAHFRSEVNNQTRDPNNDPVIIQNRVTTNSDYIINPVNVRLGISVYF